MKTEKLVQSEENEINELLEILCSNEGLKREEARKSLVKKSANSLPLVIELLDSEEHICRWEAIKVIAEINSPDSIPVLLETLTDESADIRWIASEGLIRMGTCSVKPLLEEILDKHDSVFVLNGAHHVFSELSNKQLLPSNFPVKKLLNLLKVSGNPSSLKILIHKILEGLNRKSR